MAPPFSTGKPSVWTPRSDVAYSEIHISLSRELQTVRDDGARDEVRSSAEGLIRKTASAMAASSAERDDAEALAGMLWWCDEASASLPGCFAQDLRFSTGIRAMSLKNYAAALAAWDDCGRAFTDAAADPDLPNNAFASRTLRDVCSAILDIQRAVRSNLRTGREPGSVKDLSALLQRIL